MIDEFLQAHLFGDIFGRDNLDFQSREIATIAALATLGRVKPQLKAHFNVGLNVGLSDAQLRGIVSVIDASVDKKQADDAAQALDEILRSRPARQNSPDPRAKRDLPPLVVDDRTVLLQKSMR